MRGEEILEISSISALEEQNWEGAESCNESYKKAVPPSTGEKSELDLFTEIYNLSYNSDEKSTQQSTKHTKHNVPKHMPAELDIIDRSFCE